MMLESSYQKKVMEKYEKEGFFVIKLIKTNRVGIPDLICIKPNQVVFVEVKGKRTKISQLQLYFHKKLEELGFKVIIDRSSV